MPELHGAQLPIDGLHVAIRYRVADAPARAALVLTPNDVGALLLQDDIPALFVLLDTTPVTWMQCADAAAVAAALTNLNNLVNGAVRGPASATDNAIARFDLTTGKLIQDSTATLSDAGTLAAVALNITGNITVGGTVDGVDVSSLAAVPSYVTLASTPTLGNERALTAGAGITITDGGAGGAVTVASTVPSGAPTNGAVSHARVADAALTNERVLTAGTGITLTPGAGTLTVASTGGGGGAPVDAEYLVSTASTGLSAERVLTAGAGITLTPAAGVLTVASTIAAGAPTTAQYLTLAADATLTNERVLTAGAGISLVDAGAGGALTVANRTLVNAQVASYTLVLADAGKIVSISNAAASTLTVSSAANFPIGTVIHGVQQGAGKITLIPSGVTFQVAAGKTLVTAGQYSKVTLTHITTNYWNVTGDLEETPSYLTLAADGALANERVLTAGAGITLTDAGAGGALTVASTIAAGAPTTAQYLTLAADATLTDERVLTAGTGVQLTDAGAGGALTVSSTGNGARNFQSGTAYTLVLDDAGKTISLNNAALVTLTIPTAVVPFPEGTEIFIHTGLAGGVAVVPAGGVTLHVPVGRTATTTGQNAMARLFKLSASWVIEGDLQESTSLVTLGTTGQYPNERVLTAGTGITFTDAGAGGALTVNATGGGGGAPTTAQYLTLATDATLTNERVLTAGGGIAFADGGAGGALTIRETTPYITTSASAYTPGLADAGASLGCAVACTVTIAHDTTVNFPVGTKLYFQQSAAGAAQITVAPAASVTIDVPGGKVAKTRGSNSSIYVHKIIANYWMIGGDLA